MKNVVKISILLMTLYSGASLAILSDSPKAKANLKGLVRSQGISEASADRVVRQLITESARNSSLSMKKGQQGPLIARITAIRGELSAAAGGDVSVAPPSREELTAMAPGLMAASAATVERVSAETNQRVEKRMATAATVVQAAARMRAAGREAERLRAERAPTGPAAAAAPAAAPGSGGGGPAAAAPAAAETSPGSGAAAAAPAAAGRGYRLRRLSSEDSRGMPGSPGGPADREPIRNANNVAAKEDSIRVPGAPRDNLVEYIQEIDESIVSLEAISAAGVGDGAAAASSAPSGSETALDNLRDARGRVWDALVEIPTANPGTIPDSNQVTASRLNDLNDKRMRRPTDAQIKAAAVRFGYVFMGGVKHFYQAVEVEKINDDGSIQLHLFKTTNRFPSDRPWVKPEDNKAKLSAAHKRQIESKASNASPDATRPLEVGDRLLIKGLTGTPEDAVFVPTTRDDNWKFIVYPAR